MRRVVFRLEPEEGRESVQDDGTEDLYEQGRLAQAGFPAPGLKMAISRRFYGRYQRRSDFLWSFVAKLLIYRPHVRKAMADLLEMDCTFADLVASDGTPLIMSSVKVLDGVVDMDKSSFTYEDDGAIRSILAPTFNEQVLAGHCLFRLPLAISFGEIFATDEFVELYRKLGYHGLWCEPLPVWDWE